jgi:hypothetical protein
MVGYGDYPVGYFSDEIRMTGIKGEFMGNFEKVKQNAAQAMCNHRGTILLVVGLSLTFMIGFIALAVDIGHVMVTKNELQNTADAAALAGTRALGKKYEPMTPLEQTAYVCDPVADNIVGVVQDVAGQNEAGHTPIVIMDDEIEVGIWDADAKTFAKGYNQPDAVRIKARKDALQNAPIATFFARIFGIDTVDVSATATAALTALSTANVADLELPVGISKVWLDGSFCNKDIHFYPTDSCAGWTDFQTKKGSYDPEDKSVSNPDILDLLHDIRLRKLPYPGMPPQVISNSTQLPFTGGTLSNPTFAEMEALFNSRKTCCDESGNFYWDTLVLVYERLGDTTSQCGNPNDTYTIVGFVTIRLTEVIDAAGKYLKANVECDRVKQGRGGGGKYGTKGSIPNLVQ